MYAIPQSRYRPFSTEMNFLGNETLGPLIDSRYHKDGFLQIFKGTISNHRTHTICTENVRATKMIFTQEFQLGRIFQKVIQKRDELKPNACSGSEERYRPC